MYKFHITDRIANVNVVSSDDIYSNLLTEIPKMDLINVSVHQGHSLETKASIVYINTEKRKISYDHDTIYLTWPFESLKNGKELIYILESLMEKEREEKKVLSCHASCIEKKGKAYLFLGGSGSGKTSIALYAAKNYGYNICGNDVVYVDFSQMDAPKIVGGSKYLYLRENVAKLYVPEKRFKETFDDEKENWKKKIHTSVKELGFGESDSGIISKVINLHVNEHAKEVYCDTRNGINERIYLNEDFSRRIRGIHTAVFNGQSIDSYYPSLDSECLFEFRKTVINHLCESEMVYMTGKCKDIINIIENER